MSLPPAIQAYLNSEEYKRERAKMKAEMAEINRLAEPVMKAVTGKWRRLSFTPEAMEIQAGDPDIAFQCEWGDWVIRVDYAGEIGDYTWFWKRGHEDEATETWKNEFFAHGTPGPAATEAEVEEYGWALESAIRGFAYQVLMPSRAVTG